MDIDKIIDIVRTLKEEGGPTMAMGHGQIAGSVEANYDPNFTSSCKEEKEERRTITILARGLMPGAKNSLEEGI